MPKDDSKRKPDPNKRDRGGIDKNKGRDIRRFAAVPRRMAQNFPFTSIGHLKCEWWSDRGGCSEELGLGTGFVIGNGQYLLTAAHVLDLRRPELTNTVPKDAVIQRLTFFPWKAIGIAVPHWEMEPEYVKGHRGLFDVAMCKLATKHKPLRMRWRSAPIGKDDDRWRVFAGYLRGEVVASEAEIEPWSFQTQDPIFIAPKGTSQQGMSGGPVMFRDGRDFVVDGVISGSFKDRSGKCIAAPLTDKKLKIGALRGLESFIVGFMDKHR